MSYYKEIYNYTFKYKGLAWLTILFNFLFVVFNLLSLVLFVPVLQLIFRTEAVLSVVRAPTWQGGPAGIVQYVKDSYNYEMYILVKTDPKGALLFVCVSVFLAFLLKNVFRYGAVWTQSKLRMSVVRDVRGALFEKSLKLPLSYHSNEKKGDLMARMNSDVNEIEVAVVSLLELIFREPLAILINLVTLIYMSPQLTLISLLLLPVSAFVISRIGKSLKRTAHKTQEQLGFLYASMDEHLGGVRVIKAFDAIGFITRAFQQKNDQHQKLATRVFRKRDLSPLVNETLGATVLLALVYFGGRLILNGEEIGLTGEVFLTYIIVFSQFLRPIQSVSNNMANMTKAQASQDRINSLLHAQETINNKPDCIQAHEFKSDISFNKVCFSYQEQGVLQDINWSVKKGSLVAIVGESGSGKSTLMDLLQRFYDVSSGSIEIDGVDIRDLSLNSLRSLIGVVSQESILFNLSAAQNIAFGDENPDFEKITAAAKVANAHEFISELDNGYQTILGERGNKLSGGQKQRIAIARAVYKNPAILILDEATSALDTASETLVQQALENLMQQRTSIVIAHRLSTVKNADEIIVLSKGQIVERGDHESLLSQESFYKKLCALQGLA
jgi:ATP-binding cassette, subfamily B, bacterial MsbA